MYVENNNLDLNGAYMSNKLVVDEAISSSVAKAAIAMGSQDFVDAICGRPNKPVVKYMKLADAAKPKVGFRVWVMPLDHPRTELNYQAALTSTVVSVQPNGDFESTYTRYVLDSQQQSEV